MHGGVPNKEFNENNNQCILDKKLSSILNGLAIDRSLLDNPDHIQYIMFLLGEGADRDTQNRHGKTLSHYLDKRLSDILGWLASDRGKLNDYIRSIISLLQAGADPNTKGQDGKTPLDYLNEELLNILNQLAIDSNLLDNSNNTQYIMLLLGTGANPNVRNQAGKTLLHYVAERNDIDGIRYFLGVVKANSSIRDQGGKTPFEYVTEHNCLQAIKDLGYDLDDSHENEGNPTTPNGSVDDCSNSSGDDSQIESVKLSDCNTEEDSDYHSGGSCENEENPANNSSNYPNKHNDDQTLHDDPGYGSGDDNKTISTEPSDCDRKDEDSSCSSSDYLFLEDSLLAKLGIPLTTDEKKLIDKFCGEIRGITAQNKQESEENILESIEKIVDEYLEEGIRLNSSCSNDNDNGDKETVTNLILEEMAEVIGLFHVSPRNSTVIRDPCNYGDPEEGDGKERQALDTIIKEITSSLVLKGGIEKKLYPFSGVAE
ncbi:MAG: ankyrin repeat domain-containing protein [Wolbachia sp.]